MNNIKETIRKINSELAAENENQKVISFATINESLAQRTVIANLALMYGQAGVKTIIVDADFSQDSFSKSFDLKSKIGLSDFLNNKVVGVSSIIQKIPGMSVSLVSSGTLKASDTHYLVGDSRFKMMIDKLRGEYDRILINTPVIENFNEIQNIFMVADGVLLVLSTKETKKRLLFKLAEDLSKTSTPVLGYINTEE